MIESPSPTAPASALPESSPHESGASDAKFTLPEAPPVETRFFPLDAVCMPTEHVLKLTQSAAQFGGR